MESRIASRVLRDPRDLSGIGRCEAAFYTSPPTRNPPAHSYRMTTTTDSTSRLTYTTRCSRREARSKSWVRRRTRSLQITLHQFPSYKTLGWRGSCDSPGRVFAIVARLSEVSVTP